MKNNSNYDKKKKKRCDCFHFGFNERFDVFRFANPQSTRNVSGMII